MSSAVATVEDIVLRRAAVAGLKVNAHNEGYGRLLVVTEPETGNHIEVRFAGCRGGVSAGVFIDGDWPLSGLPHRTGARGTLERVEERIALVDPDDPDSFAALHGILDIGFRNIENDEALAKQDAALDLKVDGVLDLADSDRDAARAALKHAISTTLTHAEIDRLFDAYERYAGVSRTPSFG